MIPSFLGRFCSSIFVDGCERGQGRGAGGTAGGASLAPINKNREHDGPCLYPYVDHIWPGIITTIDVRRIDYIDHGITTASDVRTTYSHPDDLLPTWNHYNQRRSDDLLPSGRLGSSHSILNLIFLYNIRDVTDP